MSVVPGSFLEDNSEQRSISSQSVMAEMNTQNEMALNTRKTLKKRRQFFQKSLVDQLDTLGYMFILIIYMYDCSFLGLLIRIIPQFSNNMNLPYNLYEHLIQNELFILNNTIISNLLTIGFHLLLPLPKPQSYNDGYLYGGLTISFIGQHSVGSVWSLIVLDIFVLFIQLLLHQINFNQKELGNRLDSDDEPLDAMDEFDGYQGETVATVIKFHEIFNIKKGGESLAGEGDNVGYGATSNST